MFPWKRLNYDSEEWCFLCSPCLNVVTRMVSWEATVGALTQLWDIRQPVRTLAEDIVRFCYRETSSGDIEDVMYAAVTVIFRVCKAVRLIYLLVVTSCVYKWVINSFTNPNPVYSHTYTWQYLELYLRKCPWRFYEILHLQDIIVSQLVGRSVTVLASTVFSGFRSLRDPWPNFYSLLLFIIILSGVRLSLLVLRPLLAYCTSPRW
jgi:hypothetical protein